MAKKNHRKTDENNIIPRLQERALGFLVDLKTRKGSAMPASGTRSEMSVFVLVKYVL